MSLAAMLTLTIWVVLAVGLLGYPRVRSKIADWMRVIIGAARAFYAPRVPAGAAARAHISDLEARTARIAELEHECGIVPLGSDPAHCAECAITTTRRTGRLPPVGDIHGEVVVRDGAGRIIRHDRL